MNDDTDQNNVNDNVQDDANKNGDEGSSVPANWIKVTDGKFICSECENESEPETNTVEGTVKADLQQITDDLKQYPSKVIYGICPVCGMEYVFRMEGDELYLEPSEMEK